jgi:hypothetical protein
MSGADAVDSLAAAVALVVVLVMKGLLKRRRGPMGPFAEMDRFWQQARSLAGGYLGLITVVLLAIQSLRGLIASHYKFYRVFAISSNDTIL